MTNLLPVGDGHMIAWSVHGDPEGIPVLLLHGGPGSGRSTSSLSAFDLRRVRVVAFDQRGCGASIPHAADDLSALNANTTSDLIDDIEKLRSTLGISAWLVVAGSWGTTLALAYAQSHPSAVTGLVLHAVTTTSYEEISWLTHDAGRFFPEEHSKFVAHVPVAGENLVAAYYELLIASSPLVHQSAADAWCAWDRLQGSLDPSAKPSPRWGDPRFRLGFARLVTHYWSHAGFLPDGQLLAGCGKLASVPGVLIHGRLDIGSPPITAYRVHTSWPGSRLEIVEGAGHGTDLMRSRVTIAVEELLGLRRP